MHVAVLGAGVAGVTTAYYLSQLGHEVSLVDQAGDVASGASHANGGQLSYSFVDAMARPRFLLQLPRLLANADPAVRVRPRGTSALTRWGLKFVRECTPARSNANTRQLLQLALRSSQLLRALRETVALDFDFRAAGKLVLLRKPQQLDAAERACEEKRAAGCNTRVLDRDATFDIEPAVAAMREPVLGAVYSSEDQVADAAKFCRELTAWLLRRAPVQTYLGHAVQRIVTAHGRAVGVETEREQISAQAVVVCLGARSPALLAPLRINTNIYPVRGYSVTLPPGTQPPTVSISDTDQRIVFSGLNERIRIAGFADFVGFDERHDEQRVAALLRIAAQVAPDAADYTATPNNAWGGYRPMTPSGRPCTGATAMPGLFQNTGHGMLGWTLACASAFDTAHAVTNAN